MLTTAPQNVNSVRHALKEYDLDTHGLITKVKPSFSAKQDPMRYRTLCDSNSHFDPLRMYVQVELMAAMKKARLPVRHAEVEELLRKFDPNNLGGIFFEDFAARIRLNAPLSSLPKKNTRSPSLTLHDSLNIKKSNKETEGLQTGCCSRQGNKDFDARKDSEGLQTSSLKKGHV